MTTDVTLPEIGGRELASGHGRMNPQLKILYMSGYTADVIARHGVLQDGLPFIHKPFSKSELALSVRRIIKQYIYIPWLSGNRGYSTRWYTNGKCHDGGGCHLYRVVRYMRRRNEYRHRRRY